MLTIIENKNESIDIVNENGDKKTFIPNFDLEKSKELLTKFNNIKTKDGKYIYELWEHNGYYLFPAFQEWLYWDYFVHIVKHKEARKYLNNSNYEFKTHSYYTISGLKRIYNLLNYNTRNLIVKKMIFNLFSALSRYFSNVEKIVLRDDGNNGFRYKKLKEIIGKTVKYSSVKHISKDNLFGDSASLYIGYKKLVYQKNKFDFDEESLTALQDHISIDEFYQLINSIDCRIQDILEETKVLEKYLSNTKVEKVISYDQIEGNLALILASKRLNIKTYGYQHGVIMKHHAGWLGFGIPKEFCNLIPDKLIVWGNYWKDKLIKYSNKYNENNIIVGTNPKEEFNKKCDFKVTNNVQKTILIPFEFLADNSQLSIYISELLNLGFKVIIKLRPKGAFGDGDMDSDLFAYDESIRDKVTFKYEITEKEIIENIDVVGCMHSTYAYEMMQYSKPIWYFESGLTFLEDIVEDEIAYLINEETIEKFSDINILNNYLEPSYNKNRIKEIFGNINLEDFILKEILK